jgi:hypothetical protein
VRFELIDRGDATEFWVSDVDVALEPALAGLWWERVGSRWRRSFACQAARARPAFENLQRLLLPALRQSAGLDPVPWEDALAEVCTRFGPADVGWWLGGSAALAARGVPVSPHDLDLIVAGSDAVRVGDLLADGLIEPVVPGEWDLSESWGRAVVHARVEWAGGVTPAADEPQVTDFGPVAAAALETIRWHDWEIRVPPLRLQRAVSVRRGLHDRAGLIDAWMAVPPRAK